MSLRSRIEFGWERYVLRKRKHDGLLLRDDIVIIDAVVVSSVAAAAAAVRGRPSYHDGGDSRVDLLQSDQTKIQTTN